MRVVGGMTMAEREGEWGYGVPWGDRALLDPLRLPVTD